MDSSAPVEGELQQLVRDTYMSEQLSNNCQAAETYRDAEQIEKRAAALLQRGSMNYAACFDTFLGD